MTEAEDRAKALRTDGKGVHKISLEQWVELFGIQGQEIFDELQEQLRTRTFCLPIIIAYSFWNMNYN